MLRRFANALVLSICALLLNARSSVAASLTVRWSPPAAERPEKISLLPVDIAVPAEVTPAQLIERWTRSIAGSQQRWDALPTGTYRIVFRSTIEPVNASPPVDLGEVVLAADDNRTVTVTLPAPPTNQAVTVQLRVSGAAQVTSVTQWRDGVRSSLSPRPRAGGVDLTAPCTAGSILVIEEPTLIGSVKLDGDCSAPIAVTLFPRASLVARVTVPAGVQLPKSGSLRCTGNIVSETPFAVIDSRVDAAVPASCQQMTFVASGFAPVALRSFDAGRIALTPGAAASFRIRSAATGDLLGGIRVTAVRAHDLGAMRRDQDIETVSVATAVSEPSGWLRLAGLPEERIVFFLFAPGRKQPQVSEPYVFRTGAETIGDDLLLQPAAMLHVMVQRPDGLGKSLKLDSVEILPRGHNHWPQRLPISGILTPAGAVLEDVPPGPWDVYATGRLDNGFAIRAATTAIEIVAGADQHVMLTIRDNVYHGRVTRAGSPVAGTINLKPSDRRSASRSAVAKVGADGTFQVLLESAGDYAVRVQRRDDGGSVALDHYIAFTDTENDIEIELPVGRIAGRVVDSAGAPVSGASVAARQQIAEPAGEAYARNAPDGRFVVESVGAGTWELVASTKTSRSEPVIVSVDDSDLSDVILRLDPVRIVRVRLTDITGVPVREAFVAPQFPLQGSLRTKGVVQHTNPDGVAEFRLSDAEQALPISLAFVTLDLRLSCAFARLDADQTFTMPPAFGELRLEGRDWERVAGSQPWLLSSSGCAVPFMGTQLERDVVIFPRLAAGTWSLVETRTPRELEQLLTGRGANLTAIQTFKVDAGNMTRVSLRQ
ncbi:MAG TPA: carboxypeptidase-like regulatory domain-containing protein [Thermoanaerobaculia bacterium]|nr:carboxypeptidase-like regulatory domain-containing protein [Thermoanaerobaculia bacterium]